jgi:guanyl-specific ribonuclease Sa
VSRSRWLIVGILAVTAGLGWQQYRRAAPVLDAIPAAGAMSPAPDDGLPPEARDTLRRISRGGPFPYDRDGAIFGNFEKRLPARPRGHYHEYTVPTPGVGHRGARRIVAGGDPPSEFYYTDDHYETFRRVEGNP